MVDGSVTLELHSSAELSDETTSAVNDRDSNLLTER